MAAAHRLLPAALAVALLAAAAQAQDSVTPPAPVTPLAPAPTATPVSTTPAAAVPAEEPAAEPAAKAAVADAPDEDTPAAPGPVLKRPRFTAAVLQATDKITAETLRFEAKVGERVRYKGLIVTLRACETNAADEDVDDSIANLDVLSQPQGVAGGVAAPAKSVFRGWMFASTPGLHAFEHPLYDLWVIACRTSAPVTPAAPAPRKAGADPSKA